MKKCLICGFETSDCITFHYHSCYDYLNKNKLGV